MAIAAGFDLLGVLENGQVRSAEIPPVTAQPMTLTRYQDTTIRLTIKYANGPLVDLTGKTVTLNVRRRSSDAGWIIRKSGVGPNVLAGKGRADIPILDTDLRSVPPGRYVYDVWLVETATSAIVQIIPVSQLVVLPGMQKAS